MKAKPSHRLARRIVALTLAFALGSGAVGFTAARVTGVRTHSGAGHDRIVLDLTESGVYRLEHSADGREVTLDLTGSAASGLKRMPVHTSRIESIRYSERSGHFLVTLRLKAGLVARAGRVGSPARVYVDVLPDSAAAAGTTARPTRPRPAEDGNSSQPARPADDASAASGLSHQDFDGLYTEIVAPGVAKKTYIYWDDAGKVTAYFVEADHNRYRIAPELARGQVPGRQSVSGISDRTQAVAAINANYFAPDGDIIGIMKIDGLVCGTTYYRRSAVGIMPDGSLVWGRGGYDGQVTLGSATQPVGGVDCERGADELVIYNKWYGKSTRTNEYGREYVVRGGRVAAINTNDSPIPTGTGDCVISVHGRAAEAFADVQVGDKAVVRQELGHPWDEARDIIGVGPRLVENDQVNVTVAEEQFPGDIRYGRAPRSAFAVLDNGNYLFGVVDGRQAHSVGLTLTDWAKLLRKFGARNAINFDGGGSSELVLGGKILNSPSDGAERPVGSALILQSR